MCDTKRKVCDMRNNLFTTNEILELLEGNEEMTALEFVCKCILGVKPENIDKVLENINSNRNTTMHKFLVQKIIDNEVCGSIYSETELINYLNLCDCSDEEYRIYDISILGEAKEVFYNGWKPHCLIEVTDSNGIIIASGYGTDH